MRLRSLCLLLPLAFLPARAQESLDRPAPLAPAPEAVSPGDEELTWLAARRAQELGFPTAAADLYGELRPNLAGADRSRAALDLVTALLDAGRIGEAEKVLRQEGPSAGPGRAPWRLRAGLIAAARKRFEEARRDLAEAPPGQLGPGDRPWRFFLQGMLADADGNLAQASDFYAQAEKAAGTDLARARFLLAAQDARLRLGSATTDAAEQARLNAERFQGTETGYDFARSYAVMLAELGRTDDAVAWLQQELSALPWEERGRGDDFRLLLGLIAGGRDGPGRAALVQLLETAADPDSQRAALQLLARASVSPPERNSFEAELDRLIALPTPPPVLEDLLLFRASWALGDKDYALAEEDANALLERFPDSPLKAHALGVLAGSAWEQRRFRTAAAAAIRASASLPSGPDRARIGVLVAEAWFRAGDFRDAADAYAAALREPPPGMAVGRLMFQRVEAEIEGASPQTAASVLDSLAGDPAFDPVDRWKAEWNLSRALELAGQAGEAYSRVSRLLRRAGRSGDLPPDLLARMAWLQARLSFDIHEPGRTLELVAAGRDRLDGLTPALRAEIESTDELLAARAYFDLGREKAGLGALQDLRARFARSNAALQSYLVEADYYARQDRIVEAQQMLTRLADDFPDSPYAPYALYQAALQAERLGQDNDLIEANRLIESLISNVARYPGNDPRQDLVFYARLKQGDLLRKLNQFPQAQQVYESLLNNFSEHKDVVLAQLALAECHDAQSATDPSHAESALILFEHLRDRVDAPVDVRVEAGFNLGYLLARRGRADQAQAAWWRDVVTAFLLDPARAAELGPKGRYWMARTLLELGSLYEKSGEYDQAQGAWKLLIRAGLPGQALARSDLARFNAPPAAP